MACRSLGAAAIVVLAAAPVSIREFNLPTPDARPHDTTIPPLPSAMQMPAEPMRLQPAPALSVSDDVLELPGDATDSASIAT